MRKLFFIAGMLAAIILQAQTVEGLRITKDYRGRLDDILRRIGKDENIRFVYDTSHVSRYTASINPSEEKTVGGMLRMFRRAWDMETWISNDGYIYIARDKTHLEELKSKKAGESIEKQIIKRSDRRDLQPHKKNFTLTGNIFDAANGERIPFAWVSVFGTTKGVTADASGYFILEQTPSDTVTLVVQYIGYQTQYIALEPSAEENSPLRIELEVQPQTIAEVFIIGRKDDKALQQSTGEHKMKMSPVALKVLPNLGEKDIMRGFQLMPGVSASNENSSGMYVRGGTPDQNLIVYDGFTVYYVDHLHGFYSAFNANAVKDVQLYKGGFESKYGGRLSSVTEITAKDGNARKVAAGGEVNLLSINAYAEAPIGDKFTSLFAFRRSYQGYLYGKIGGSNDDEAATSPIVSRPGGRGMQMEMPDSYFYDLNAKLTYRPTENDMFSLSFFNGTDYVDNTPQFSFPGGGRGGMTGGGAMPSFSMENANYENYGNTGMSLRWARTWNEKLTSNALLSFSNFYSTRDQTRSTTMVRNDTTTTVKSGILEENNLMDFSLKDDWKYSLNEKHVWEAGLFTTHYNIDYSYAQSDTAKILEKANNAFLAGVYVQDKIKLLQHSLTVIPGVRLTYYGPVGKFYAEPRLSANYRLSERITLNAATGLYYQFANRVVREDVLSGNTDFWILSNGEDIPVSSSTHFNFGVNYDLPDYLFSVEGYYKLNDNISEYTLRFENSTRRPGGFGFDATAAVSQVSEQFYTGNGYALGLEFLAQKKAGNFSGWISYTLAQVKNRFPEQSDKYFFAGQDVTHELKTVGIYKFGNFDFSATLIYSTGRPYTAPTGAYQITPVGGTAASFYAVSDKNNFRLPDYIRLDVAATWRFDLFGTKGKAHAIGLSLFNALNRKNVSAKQFEIVNDVILESNINYLSITPNVSLIFKF